MLIVPRQIKHKAGVARKNAATLGPLLAYHEMLRRKYELARAKPWRIAPPDPPEPR